MADSIEQLRSEFEKLQERNKKLCEQNQKLRDDAFALSWDIENFGKRLRDFAEAGGGSSSAERLIEARPIEARAIEAIGAFNTQSNGLSSPEKRASLNRSSSSVSGLESGRIGRMPSVETASVAGGTLRGVEETVPRQTSEQRASMPSRTVGTVSSVPTPSIASSRVARASFPVVETSVPTSSRNESEKIKSFVDDYHRVCRITGYKAKTEQDAFLSRHQVRGIQCTNFTVRANHPEIEPRFADAGAPQKGDFWALFIGSNLYAVVPNAKPYGANKHNEGGMKEAFDSNYDSGTYPNIEVTKPAFFRQQGTDWTIVEKGHIRLSRA